MTTHRKARKLQKHMLKVIEEMQQAGPDDRDLYTLGFLSHAEAARVADFVRSFHVETKLEEEIRKQGPFYG